MQKRILDILSQSLPAKEQDLHDISKAIEDVILSDSDRAKVKKFKQVIIKYFESTIDPVDRVGMT